jgi:hypothetical protein
MWRVGILAAAVWLAACGGDDDHSGPSGTGFLFENNAQFNGGRTVRWPSLPIRVHLGDGVARSHEVSIWTAETGGAVTFAFVGSPSAADITFRFRSGSDVCGVTLIEYSGDGRIVTADVQLSRAIYRGPQCVRTVTHETAHAIGFLSHTDDGGLMDDDGGNGEVTPPVAQMLRELYLLAPGTAVQALARRPFLERPRGGGGNTMTFVYPVRR